MKLIRVSHSIRLWEDRKGAETVYHIETSGYDLWQDTFDSLEHAILIFDKLNGASREQRLALSSCDPGADAMLELKLRLESLGGEIDVWGVLKEDAYETTLGDGYYAYLEAAFDTKGEADAFISDNAEHMIRWHLRRYTIRLVDGEPTLIVMQQPADPAPEALGELPFTSSSQWEPVDLNTLLACWQR